MHVINLILHILSPTTTATTITTKQPQHSIQLSQLFISTFNHSNQRLLWLLMAPRTWSLFDGVAFSHVPGYNFYFPFLPLIDISFTKICPTCLFIHVIIFDILVLVEETLSCACVPFSSSVYFYKLKYTCEKAEVWAAFLTFQSKRKRPRTPTPGNYLGLKNSRDTGPRGDRGRYRGGYGRDDYGYRRSSRRSPYRGGGRGYSPRRRSPYGGSGRSRRDRSYSPYWLTSQEMGHGWSKIVILTLGSVEWCLKFQMLHERTYHEICFTLFKPFCAVSFIFSVCTANVVLVFDCFMDSNECLPVHASLEISRKTLSHSLLVK